MRKAVIDMGTNSTRLAVAEWSDRGLQMVETKVAETRNVKNPRWRPNS